MIPNYRQQVISMLQGPNNPSKPQTKKPFKAAIAQKAPILISFRLEGKSLGKASFYDHYTISSHTGFQTAIAKANHPEIQTKYLRDYISEQTVNIPYATLLPEINRPMPLVLNAYEQGGLLVIPGMTRDSYEMAPQKHTLRISFEQKLIADSLRRGRPIVAICAGSWTLWEALGGQTVAVKDHNYGGGMPRISTTGKMTHNKHVHDVKIVKGTLLQTAMGLPDIETDSVLPANSIHWKAPSDKTVPGNVEIAARSKNNPNVTIHTRQSTVMEPDEDIVEAFSSILGAPTIGFLWHPEAFESSSKTPVNQSNNAALLFMAKAGSAFEAKQNMLAQYKQKAQEVADVDVNGLQNIFEKLKI